MKITLTLEFIALLMLIIGWGIDVKNRSNYHTTDGGWTTYYQYKEWARKLAYNLSYLAGVVAILGILYLIWFY